MNEKRHEKQQLFYGIGVGRRKEDAMRGNILATAAWLAEQGRKLRMPSLVRYAMQIHRQVESSVPSKRALRNIAARLDDTVTAVRKLSLYQKTK